MTHPDRATTRTGQRMLARTARFIYWFDNLGRAAKASIAIGAALVGLGGALLAGSEAIQRARGIWFEFRPVADSVRLQAATMGALQQQLGHLEGNLEEHASTAADVMQHLAEQGVRRDLYLMCDREREEEVEWCQTHVDCAQPRSCLGYLLDSGGNQ